MWVLLALLSNPIQTTVVDLNPQAVGPPPDPATWDKKQLTEVQAKFPILFTTATNDGAFWPAPYTAQHELGCFNGGTVNTTKPARFIQFNAVACNKDHSHPPFDSSGHDCPFKSGVETPWVLTMMKFYAQQEGSASSSCNKMLSSIVEDSHVEKFVYAGP